MIRMLPILALVSGCATDDPSDPTTPDVPRFDGAAFRIDFTRSTLEEPAGAEELMDLLLAGLSLVVQFSGDGANASAISAISDIDDGIYHQDPCSRSIAFDQELGWADPDITIAAVDWTFEAYDLSVPMRRLNMSAVMSEDSLSLEDFALTAYLDAADFTVAAGDTPPCELVGSFGIDCQLCEDEPGRAECLNLSLTNGTAPRVELAADLVPVTAADVAAHADCATTGS